MKKSLMWHDMSSMAKQEDITISVKNGERKDEAFRIPKRLNERHRRFLWATLDNWERGTVGMHPECLWCSPAYQIVQQLECDDNLMCLDGPQIRHNPVHCKHMPALPRCHIQKMGGLQVPL